MIVMGTRSWILSGLSEDLPYLAAAAADYDPLVVCHSSSSMGGV